MAARTTDDVVAAVNFARENNLRLVVKGGGHSYQGTSNAADSLLIWTRGMNAVTLHDAFVGAGCAGRHAPQPAVTVEAGAIWGQVYDAVTTEGGPLRPGRRLHDRGRRRPDPERRLRQLLEGLRHGRGEPAGGRDRHRRRRGEDRQRLHAIRTCSGRIKGGGGGSLGVVTRLTLRTHDLPEFFGAVFTTIQATSDAAFRRLIGRIVGFYGETAAQSALGRADRLPAGQRPRDRDGVPGARPAAGGGDLAPVPRLAGRFAAGLQHRVRRRWILAAPARRFWDPAFLKKLPGLVLADDRPGAPEANVFWAGNLGEAGQVLHGYQSAWLPASLLQTDRQEALGDALFAASRHWGVSLHVNKGLAGAPAEAIAAARDTATNPAVLDAFALVISGAEGPPAYPGIPGHEPDLAAARRHAEAIDRAMDEMRKLLPNRRLLRGGEQLLRRRRGGNPSGVRTTRGCSR